MQSAVLCACAASVPVSRKQAQAIPVEGSVGPNSPLHCRITWLNEVPSVMKSQSSTNARQIDAKRLAT